MLCFHSPVKAHPSASPLYPGNRPRACVGFCVAFPGKEPVSASLGARYQACSGCNSAICDKPRPCTSFTILSPLTSCKVQWVRYRTTNQVSQNLGGAECKRWMKTILRIIKNQNWERNPLRLKLIGFKTIKYNFFLAVTKVTAT